MDRATATSRIYVDNIAQTTVANPKNSSTLSITQSVSIATGKHSLVVVAYPAAGGSFSSSESITVQSFIARCTTRKGHLVGGLSAFSPYKT